MAGGLALIASGLVFGGCTTYSPEAKRELLARAAPVPTLVRKGDELVAAEAHAARCPRSFAMIGSGKSMEPMYGSGTAIVVYGRRYDTMRKGMHVVDRNKRGSCGAHMLVEQMRDGWIAIGVNNAKPDDELVTRDNYVGVAKAAYSSAGTPLRADAAARVSPKDGIERDAKLSSPRRLHEYVSLAPQ